VFQRVAGSALVYVLPSESVTDAEALLSQMRYTAIRFPAVVGAENVTALLLPEFA